MRIKRIPEDFRVEELIEFPGQSGPYAYYRVEKRNRSTLAVRAEMASRLKVTPGSVVFPALKDKFAVTVQHASVRKQGPEVIEGRDFVARRVGWGPRALRPSDLLGNRFTITARDLSEETATALFDTVRRLSEDGLPNYFDDQRFGSFSDDGFIGKAILERDAERVVRLYLSAPMVGDTEEVRKFKALVSTHWGQWGYLLHQAPRPSNYRSVLTFLKDHPREYRKAANLIQDRLLSIYLVAYQSWVWNRLVGRYFEVTLEPERKVRIYNLDFPLPERLPEAWRDLTIAMPNLTATYPPDWQEALAYVLETEGLTMDDFKARILRRVYLPKGERRIWFAPDEVEGGEVVADAYHEGRMAATVRFTLEPGRYATLVMKAAAARLDAPVNIYRKESVP